MSDDDSQEKHAEVVLNGKQLVITPKSAGTEYFTLCAESNGRPVTKTVAVKIDSEPTGDNTGDTTGVENVTEASRFVSCDGQRIYITGFVGDKFSVYDIAGRMVNSFVVDSDRYVFDFGGHKGIYILKADSNFSSKVIIK